MTDCGHGTRSWCAALLKACTRLLKACSQNVRCHALTRHTAIGARVWDVPLRRLLVHRWLRLLLVLVLVQRLPRPAPTGALPLGCSWLLIILIIYVLLLILVHVLGTLYPAGAAAWSVPWVYCCQQRASQRCTTWCCGLFTLQGPELHRPVSLQAAMHCRICGLEQEVHSRALQSCTASSPSFRSVNLQGYKSCMGSSASQRSSKGSAWCSRAGRRRLLSCSH